MNDLLSLCCNDLIVFFCCFMTDLLFYACYEYYRCAWKLRQNEMQILQHPEPILSSLDIICPYMFHFNFLIRIWWATPLKLLVAKPYLPIRCINLTLAPPGSKIFKSNLRVWRWTMSLSNFNRSGTKEINDFS